VEFRIVGVLDVPENGLPISFRGPKQPRPSMRTTAIAGAIALLWCGTGGWLMTCVRIGTPSVVRALDSSRPTVEQHARGLVAACSRSVRTARYARPHD
jgi:hypothetical protein